MIENRHATGAAQENVSQTGLDALSVPQQQSGVLEVTPFSNLSNPRDSVSNVLRALVERDAKASTPVSIEQEIPEYEKILALAKGLVESTMRADYHDWSHAQAVASRFGRYLAASGASETVQKLGELAGIFHDADHPGFRYREDAASASHRELTNEEYAATLAVETLSPFLNSAQLQWIHDVILATSFGQRKGGDPVVNQLLDQRPHLVRPYAPGTIDEKLIHFADVNSTDSETGFEDFVRGGFKLKKEMSQGSYEAPKSTTEFQAHLTRESGFLKYISYLMNEIQDRLEPEVRARTAARLEDAQTRMAQLIENFEGKDAIAVMQIAFDVLRSN